MWLGNARMRPYIGEALPRYYVTEYLVYNYPLRGEGIRGSTEVGGHHARGYKAKSEGTQRVHALRGTLSICTL